MVRKDQVLKCWVPIQHSDFKLARRYAQRCALGGHSNVRSNSDRQARLLEDQFVGQLGQLVGTKMLFGDQHLYKIARWYQDLDPNRGDNGSDIPGLSLDFKASKMRKKNDNGDPLAYNLVVPPSERHAGNVYVLILLDDRCDADRWRAYGVGWLADKELSSTLVQSGVFKDKHIHPARDLHPLMPLRWFA